MTPDPWKRAHDLKRLGEKGQSGPAQKPARRKGAPGCFILLIMMILGIGVLAAIWATRGWWIPRYRDELPRIITDQVAEPQVRPGWQALEDGLGIDLLVLGDYLNLLQATNDWGVEWELKQLGGDHLRLTAPGVKVFVSQGQIWTYELDIKTLYTANCWANLRPALTEAHLTPDLTWTALTGKGEMPTGATEHNYFSLTGYSMPNGHGFPAWVLHFTNGWLTVVEARLDIEDDPDSRPVS